MTRVLQLWAAMYCFDINISIFKSLHAADDLSDSCTPQKASFWSFSINLRKDTDQDDVFGAWRQFKFSCSLSHFGEEGEPFLAFCFIVQLKRHHKMSGHGLSRCCFWLSITHWSLSHHLLYLTQKRNTCCHGEPPPSLCLYLSLVWLENSLF